MNWVRTQQIRRRNVSRDFLRTGFIVIFGPTVIDKKYG
jgi:hypothetical protein